MKSEGERAPGDSAETSRPGVRVCYASDSFDPHKGGGTMQYAGYLRGLIERGIRPDVRRQLFSDSWTVLLRESPRSRLRLSRVA